MYKKKGCIERRKWNFCLERKDRKTEEKVVFRKEGQSRKKKLCKARLSRDTEKKCAKKGKIERRSCVKQERFRDTEE